LDHSDFDIWNTLNGQALSNDGNYVLYTLQKGEKDHTIKIKNTTGIQLLEHQRAENGLFTYHSTHALFTIKPWKDSILEMKRRKVKKDKMPKDTLAIFNLTDNTLEKIPNVKSYRVPQKWSDIVAYYLDEQPAKKKENKDNDETEEEKSKKEKKPKKVSEKNGYHLVIRNLEDAKEDTIRFVTNFVFSKEGKRLTYTTTGDNGLTEPGVYLFDFVSNTEKNIFTSHDKTKYEQVSMSDSGKNIGFVVDADTTKVQIRPTQLYSWTNGDQVARLIVDPKTAPKGYMVSADGKISFAKDESKMYFGLSTPPILKDTTLLDEEIVNVEVWTYDEPRLYTVQELQVKNDQKKSYQAVYQIHTKEIFQVATTDYPNAQLGNEGNGPFALLSNPAPYQLEGQWTGERNVDYAIVNVTTGQRKKILSNMSSGFSLSPFNKIVIGYNSADTTWVAYDILNGKRIDLTKGMNFYDELNDRPMDPGSYGMVGWTTDDASVLLYDRYDIWEFDPRTGKHKRLTKGREEKIRYRYVKLDPEQKHINLADKWLLTTFNETTKNSGYYWYNYKRKKGNQLLDGPFRYGRPVKALNADVVAYSRQSFTEFPNIRVSDLSFEEETVISDANPQQDQYNWGTAELVHWTSLDGMPLTGMLIKPENFNPNKKYPMIVNFYEKSSDGLHGHRAPSPGRSTINYSFYTSRGYVIFNPDVYYKVGYPGESAFNCVVPGVNSLIKKGFIDPDNIGVQGHSWGGYQIAHLVTRTDMFKAAEAGAPVPNMISAYGGIRWWTGLSRQFQYEHTQSRIGGTPWQYRDRYIENSPIFFIDKINTPLLIMHNDEDGHVPWYQGIELFVSLRRLGKPSWMLNYNGEPHWPLKLQNRKDFNIRLQQFFDYYLKGEPMPVWMKRGVPAIEKGINQGLELIER
jgi:dipeptidyl aminopeptidase/acylaminoacyl peptidase